MEKEDKKGEGKKMREVTNEKVEEWRNEEEEEKEEVEMQEVRKK